MKPESSPYWFYIDNTVYVEQKKDWLLFYHTLTGQILEFQNQKKITALIRRLKTSHNGGVIPITHSQLADDTIGPFITEMRAHFMGDLIESRFSQGKPIQMSPQFKVTQDLNILQQDPSRSVGEHILKNLVEISLYINTECHQQCPDCQMYWQQFPCCVKKPGKIKEFPSGFIPILAEQIQACNIANINILGANIFLHSHFPQIVAQLTLLPFQKTFYLHYCNAFAHIEQLPILSMDKTHTRLIINFPVIEEYLHTTIDRLTHANVNFTCHFIITSEQEYAEAEVLASRFQLYASQYLPFYNFQNQQMFLQQLATDRQELQHAQLTMTDIQARQTINILHFGRLFIFPDGAIHSHIQSPRLGTLANDSLSSVLSKEIINSTYWFKTRNHVKPCKNCVFNSLCPPLSNLNALMRRNNICSIYE